MRTMLLLFPNYTFYLMDERSAQVMPTPTIISCSQSCSFGLGIHLLGLRFHPLRSSHSMHRLLLQLPLLLSASSHSFAIFQSLYLISVLFFSFSAADPIPESHQSGCGFDRQLQIRDLSPSIACRFISIQKGHIIIVMKRVVQGTSAGIRMG